MTYFADDLSQSLPIYAVADGFAQNLTPAQRAWAEAMGFKAQAGRILALPGDDGGISGLLFGLGVGDDPMVYGALGRDAPAGTYHLAGDLAPAQATQAALAFALGAYEFSRYKSGAPARNVHLKAPKGADMDYVTRACRAVYLARDLINTPPEDLGPAELADAALTVAKEFGAQASVIIGDELLAQNWPLVHAVGRASSRAPRLVDFTWGDPTAPKVTLVGKGVCFDSGGLDIKPSSGMALMKKDMGGAANILGLAMMVMAAGLKVRLRVLMPMVENSISGNAFRTSDIFKSRKGLSVEIGNTDAEGRLILADALAEADAEAPDLLIDLATLTGAARVALGPELPPFYTDDSTLASALEQAAQTERDPLWRMPLWAPYAKGLDSKIADLKSTADGGLAGSIYAALFLKRFVGHAKSWLHADIYAWSTETRGAKVQGGEAQTIRALYRVLEERYGK